MTTTAPRIIVTVCTFRRNEPLRRLLQAIELNASILGPSASVGVVVVDDNADGDARAVCDAFAGRFDLGIHYRHSGRGNIAVARNIGLDTALPLADWIAMTDDDCEPVDEWLFELLAAQARTGNDAITGPCILRTGDRAPRWLRDQPFLELGQLRGSNDEPMHLAATNNSLTRASFFADRPDLRFDPDLGVVGGEDMVFFRLAHRQGLTISLATRAIVYGNEPPERWTYQYQLRSAFWLGNSEWITNRFLGDATRPWWALRAAKAYALALTRPFRQLAQRQPLQLRFALACGARATGMLAGTLGFRIRHH